MIYASSLAFVCCGHVLLYVPFCVAQYVIAPPFVVIEPRVWAEPLYVRSGFVIFTVGFILFTAVTVYVIVDGL